MTDAATINKQLKIKTGSVVRLLKEHKMYVSEGTELRVKLERQTSEGVDEYDIKNTNNMINESAKVLEDVSGRLKDAAGKLQEYITSVEQENLSSDAEVLQAARDVLQEVRAVTDVE